MIASYVSWDRVNRPTQVEAVPSAVYQPVCPDTAPSQSSILPSDNMAHTPPDTSAQGYLLLTLDNVRVVQVSHARDGP